MSAMNCTSAFRNACCCCVVSRSQSRQNDARTSPVGIERLRPLVEGRQELRIGVEGSNATRCSIVVRLALHLLPLLRPEPCLLRVYAAGTDLAKQDSRAINRAIRQTVDQLVQLSLSHALIVARTRPILDGSVVLDLGWHGFDDEDTVEPLRNDGWEGAGNDSQLGRVAIAVRQVVV